MSTLNKVIELKPMKGEETREALVSAGHECPKCHGNGWYWHGELREMAKHDCERCNGTGRVKAIVTIKWIADYE
ncbi:MAG: hypothetical protein IKR18_11680 [Bacteroidaceae bacterium]|nr:hypothetical protein [Bacteroidaceae bacterium]